MRRRLEQIDIPGEHDASERAWRVVRSAFGEYEPRLPSRRGIGLLPLTAAAAVVALVVVAVSPAGPALVRTVRKAVGNEHAEPALVALPASGRVLVDSGAGSWIVNADGSKRLLGRYASSSWSPHGLFEIVARGHELAAVDPKGSVRWSIERKGTVRDPRWSPDGYRVAYRAGTSLRVVAGDGSGDRLLAAKVAPVSPEWQPGSGHALAYVTTTAAVSIVDTDTGEILARWHDRNPARQLSWSADGKLLLVVGSGSIDVLTATLRGVEARRFQAGRVVTASWAPHGTRYALISYGAHDNRTAVTVEPILRRAGLAHTVFVGTGHIDGVNWSPDGRWLLLAWRSADQWVFARTSGGSHIRAVASISAQFHSRRFPRLAGWCC